MLKELCLDHFQVMLTDAEMEKDPEKILTMIQRMQGFLDGLFWSNVIDSDEFMELNRKITSIYFK